MAFVKFTDTGHSFKTKLSVRSGGTIALSAGAVLRFGLRNSDFVSLFYDRDTRKIGIKPILNEEEGAHRLNKGRSGGAWIAARRFLDCFAVPHQQTRKYEAWWDESEQMIITQVEEDHAGNG